MILTELYLFTQNSVNTGFTSSLLSSTVGGVYYKPVSIKRSEINLTQNSIKSNITISISKKEAFAQNLINGISDDDPISVTIYRNGNQYWDGVVLSASRNGKYIDLGCSNDYISGQRSGLSDCISSFCQNTLYDEDCRVTKLLYKSTYEDIIINSNQVTIESMTEASGYFTWGEAHINGQKRFINKHVDKTLYLEKAFSGTQIGTLELYPGCNLKEQEDCLNKFNLEDATHGNTINCRACSYVPKKNPFGSGGLL